MNHSYIISKKDIHAFGVNYICDFLDKAGFKILEKNLNPEEHFQLLAETYDRTMLIAIRTNIYPDIGTIDIKGKEQLIKKSEQFKAIPHFAGLTLIPSKMEDNEVDNATERESYKVIFSGISVVRKPRSLAVNG